MKLLTKDVVNITKQGVYPGLSREDYFKMSGLNASSIASGIRKGLTSPLNIRESYESEDSGSTDAKDKGTLAHMACFEPDRCRTDVAVWDGGRRAGKVRKDFCDNNEGSLIIKKDDYEAVIQSLTPLVMMPEFQEYTSAGAAEVGVFAEIDGIQCKGQMDWISSSIPTLWDLKTTRDIHPVSFGRQFFDLNYQMKLGMYRELLRRNQFDVPVCVAVTSPAKPHQAYLQRVPEEVLDRGWNAAHQAILTIRECLDLDVWPGWSGGNAWVEMEVPYWEMADEVAEMSSVEGLEL